MSHARVFAVAVAIVAVVTACGDSDDEPAERTVVTTKPSPVCEQVDARRKLAKDPPQLALSLRNIDVANFSGESGPECNERQIVYWGPPPALAGGDRPMIGVRLFFLDRTQGEDELLAGSRQARERLEDGTRAAIFEVPGLVATRFVLGETIVTVTAACVNQANTADLTPQQCRRAEQSGESLRAKSLAAASRLARDLKPVLNG